MKTRVKICGITRPEDGLAAVQQGADAIGLVFYPPSPRHVSIDQAREILAQIPPFVTVVGLFVNQPAELIDQILSRVPIDLLQFHGDETPAECTTHGKPYIKAIRMRDGVDLVSLNQRYSEARALLVDSYKPGVPGGTGECFEWNRIPSQLSHRIVLAGGLNPDNIQQAILEVSPYAVDVSGGVEADKGIKDTAKIAAFMRGVERVNRNQTI